MISIKKKNEKYILNSALIFLLVLFPSISLAQEPFRNPIGAETIGGLAASILNSLMGVVAVIAVVFVVIGGIMYMSSAGDEKRIETAKKVIGGALIGVAIVFAGPTFLKEILIILQSDSYQTGNIESAPTIYQIASNTLKLVLSIAGILGIISLVFGGIMYLSSVGDEKRIEVAKKIVTYAIIGVVVAFGSLVIVSQVNNLIQVQ